jgi:hypothetical protein
LEEYYFLSRLPFLTLKSNVIKTSVATYKLWVFFEKSRFHMILVCELGLEFSTYTTVDSFAVSACSVFLVRQLLALCVACSAFSRSYLCQFYRSPPSPAVSRQRYRSHLLSSADLTPSSQSPVFLSLVRGCWRSRLNVSCCFSYSWVASMWFA